MAKVSLPPVEFQVLVGLEMTERGEGVSRCELDASEKYLDPHQVVHGGVLYSMADTGMGALYGVLGPEESCATIELKRIELKMVYLAPVRAGRLVCDSRVLHRGGRVMVMESEVRNGDRLVAKDLGAFGVFPEERHGG